MNRLVHKGTVTIETDRLILRKFVLDDAQKVYSNWLSDREVMKFFDHEPHSSVDQTINQVNKWISDYSNIPSYRWVIVIKELNEPVGTIYLNNISEKNLRAETSCMIGKKFWNLGFATEALNSLIKFAFCEMGLNRIEARHLTINPASGRVLQKARMKYEGCARQRMLCGDKFYDSEIYGIIRSDVPELVI